MTKSLLLTFTLACSIFAFSQTPTLEWVSIATGVDKQEGYGLAIDEEGNVYTTGILRDSADFEMGAGTFLLTANAEDDIYVEKRDVNSNLVWAHSTGRDYAGNACVVDVDRGITVTLSSDNTLVTTGVYSGTVDFDFGSGTYQLNSGAGNRNSYVSKIQPNGSFVWAKSFTSNNGLSDPVDVRVDDLGTIYIGGRFFDTLDVDPGVGVYNLLPPSNGMSSAMVIKLDENGNFIWGKSFGYTADHFNPTITFDEDGNTILAGKFWSALDVDPGPAVQLVSPTTASPECIIIKLDPNGNFMWSKTYGIWASAYDISTDSDKNIIIGGDFYVSADFDPGVATHTLNITQGMDGYILKLDPNGNFIWAKSFGGSGSNDRVTVLSVDKFDNILATGGFADTIDFDFGPGVHNLNGPAFGNGTFVLKTDPNSDLIYAFTYETTGLVRVQNLKSVEGKLYLTGHFNGLVDFDPGIAVTSYTSFSGGGGVPEDYFVTKFDEGYVLETSSNQNKQPKIFPNPANHEIVLVNDFVIDEYWIYDIFGRLVSNVVTAENEIIISTEEFNSGMYIIKFKSENNFFQEKILFQN